MQTLPARRKRKKEKKRRETQKNSDWIKVELEMESVDALNENVDFFTANTNQIQGASQKKKIKKKNREMNLKTEDSVEDAASGEFRTVCDTSGSGLQEDDHLEEVKHIPMKKKKMKRKQHALEETQSKQACPGEERMYFREKSCDGESALPSSSPPEHHLNKHRKKKKRRIPEEPPETIVTDEETRSTVSDSVVKTTGEVRHKKKKRKKKNREMNLKTEDSVEDAASGEFRTVCDTSGSGLQEDDHLEEVKHIPMKKKKMKRKQHALEGTRSKQACPGEERMYFREKSCDGESALPSSSPPEHHLNKHRKKKKRRIPEEPPETIVTDEETRSTVADSVEKTTGEVRHKKRKNKGNLKDLIDDYHDGDQTSPISVKKTTGDEKRHKKRKRKAMTNLNDSDQEKSQNEGKVVDNSEQKHSDLISNSGVPKKKRKRKHFSESLEATGHPESQEDPFSNIDLQENGLLSDSLQTKKRKKKSAKSADHEDDVHSSQATQKDDAKIWSRSPSIKKHTDAEAWTSLASQSPNKNRSSSNDETLHSPDSGSHKKKKYSPEEIRDRTEGGSETSKHADGPEEWNWLFNDEDKDEEEWKKDLPFHCKPMAGRTLHVKPKEGVFLKRGKWSGLEDNILKENVQSFCKQHRIKDPKMIALPFLYENSKEIWEFLHAANYSYKICQGIKRMPYHVYIRARKIFDDRNYKGAYTNKETRNIHRLQQLYGNKWSHIGQQIDRPGQSVQDWFRKYKKGKVYGKWTERENRQLRRAIMVVMGSKDGDDMDKLVGVPWREVHKFVPTRNLYQCMSQWKLQLCWCVGNRTKHIWKYADSVKLIESVYSLKSNQESDIDWSELQREFSDRSPSPAKLTLVWHNLKLRYLQNHNFMTFEDILDKLYHKGLPLLRDKIKKQDQRQEARMARMARYKSKENISDLEDDSDSEDEWY